MPETILYSAPHCPHCVQLKHWLLERHIPFTERNVATDATAREELADLTGAFSIPVLTVGGVVIIGFRPDLLDEYFPASGKSVTDC